MGHTRPEYSGPIIVDLLQPGDMFVLGSGETLRAVRVQYEMYGTMNEARNNVILLLHGFTASAHAHSTKSDRHPGWWEWMIGENNALDTTRFCVISSNVLGGCDGTTGPESVNPLDGTPWHERFPDITISDIVAVQKRLLSHLGCSHLYAVIGGSMGGMQALEWALGASTMVDRVCVLAAAASLPTHSRLFSTVARESIARDTSTQTPHNGLFLARLIANLTYGTLSEVPSPEEEIDESALYRDVRNEAIEFSHRFSRFSYALLSAAMERYIGTSPVPDNSNPKGKRSPRCTFLSYSSDWLFPPSHVAHLAEVLKKARWDVRYRCIETPRGHDAFLHENEEQAQIIREALE